MSTSRHLDGAEFHAAVYDLVRLIPPCRVTTYGHIAKLAGMPNHSRHVGQALKFLPPNTNQPIPWHRVIASAGTISSRGPGTDGARRQRDALVGEGVDVVQGRSGEFRVDLRRFGWFPLVNEAGWQGSEDGDGDGDGDGDVQDEEIQQEER